MKTLDLQLLGLIGDELPCGWAATDPGNIERHWDGDSVGGGV